MSFKSLLLSLVLILALAPGAFAGQDTVHFFVLPSATPASDLAQLNEYLIKTVGGYTAMPSRGGSLPEAGSPTASKENITYFVAAKKNLSKPFMAYLKEKLGMKDVFMLVWKADRPGL